MSREHHRKSGLRPQRLAAEILDACRSFILPQASDPVLAELEVGRVDLSPDLGNVTVLLVPAEGQAPPPAADVAPALERNVPFFRRLLADTVNMKRTPLVRLAYVPLRPPEPTE